MSIRGLCVMIQMLINFVFVKIWSSLKINNSQSFTSHDSPSVLLPNFDDMLSYIECFQSRIVYYRSRPSVPLHDLAPTLDLVLAKPLRSFGFHILWIGIGSLIQLFKILLILILYLGFNLGLLLKHVGNKLCIEFLNPQSSLNIMLCHLHALRLFGFEVC